MKLESVWFGYFWLFLSKNLLAAFLLDGCTRGGPRSDADNSSAGSDETDHESVNFVIGSSPNLTSQQSTSSSSTGGSNAASASQAAGSTGGGAAAATNQHPDTTTTRCVNASLQANFTTSSSTLHNYLQYLSSASAGSDQPTSLPPAPVLPRTRKIGSSTSALSTQPTPQIIPAKAPLPPPRRIQSQQR